MTGFMFTFPDDDKGFELLEEEAETTSESDDNDDELNQTNNDIDDVIWEVTED